MIEVGGVGEQTGDRHLAFAFPGVGVKLCGHENAFLARHRTPMTPLLDEASDYAKADLIGHLTTDRSRLTELQAQLFTYAFNCAVAQAYLHAGLAPLLMAGHSMGIYSALSAAGVIDFSEGLRIVEDAYELVAEASANHDCSMAVVVGLGPKEVAELLPGEGESILLVNSNNDTTKIFAGLRRELEELCEEARRRDAIRAELLPVAAPYHHPGFLAEATLAFERRLRGFKWSPPTCPIISSIDQRLLSNGEDLLDFTARNISTPIDWHLVVAQLVDQGVELILECGAGISLSQSGRFMDTCPPIVTVKNARRRLGL